MNKLVGVFVLIVFCGLATQAQDQQTPLFEGGGGYTYRSQELPINFPISAQRINMQGWNATLQYNVNSWLGIAGDFDGTYSNNINTGDNKVYTYTFGARVYPWHHPKVAPYFNLLIGGAHGSNTFNSTNTSDQSFALEGGGGLEIRLGNHYAFRPGEIDYELTRLGSSSPGFKNQNNFKYKFSLIVTFGEK